MLPTRTSEGDRQIALPLAYVMRQEVYQQLRNSSDELPRLRKGPNIFRHLRIAPGQRTKLRNEMWVRQEANVEDKIRVLRHSVLESEAYARDQDVLARLFFVKALRDIGAQFVNIELRGVDHQVRHLPNRTKVTPFCRQ